MLPSFTSCFHAIHGHDPYPWQARLADHVVEHGRWPATLGVPTGTGKTATLDIALYALAADASRPPTERKAPRRIVMVVDRRTIVDQSYARAQRIRQALLDAEDGPLVALRERLVSLMSVDADREEPLQITLLRGGVPRDDGWARRPDQALIALSTVDQVGSRLLFRGYGVRPTMQSVHAGLLGADSLFLLDEVHLARPFQQTLDALGTRWRNWSERPLPNRWEVVALSATSGDANAFLLDDADRSLPRLARRLGARKPVTCVTATCATHDRKGVVAKKWVRTLADEAKRLLRDGCRSVGVVVNRVDTARALATALEARKHDVVVVTGRMRPSDRSEVSRVLEDRAGPGWKERGTERPFVCVATQCIEAGADLDFDGLVTEVASLDALVQRFGRANRTGDHDAAPIVVVAPKGVEKSDDPIYGIAPAHAWAWLTGHDALDAATANLETLLPHAPVLARAPTPHAAVLVPAHLDLLSQTAPIPHPDPEPGLYLHGLEPPRPEVHVLWRADLDLADVQGAEARLAAVPPTSFEALALPLAAARRWLAGEVVAGFADAGGVRDDAADAGRRQNRPVAFRDVGDGVEVIAARQIGPGNTLVLPSGAGGIRRGCFDPEASDAVVDVGDLGRTIRTGRPHVRLDVRAYGIPEDDEYSWPAGLPAPPPVPSANRTLADALVDVVAWVEGVAAGGGDSTFHTLIELVNSVGVDARPVDGCWVLKGRGRLSSEQVLALAQGGDLPAVDNALTADDGSVVSAHPVPLGVHLEGVGRWCRGFAEVLGLPESVLRDVELAGRWHDLGKAHPRFQVLLHQGDEIRAASGALLAKSGMPMADRASRRRAWKRAALPDGFRHEMVSVVLMQSEAGQELLRQANDPDLVLHLIASHHGHARPFAPCEDHSRSRRKLPGVQVQWDGGLLLAAGDHAQDRLDSGVAERFWQLQRRYGWWGLAWMEAVVRLADHRESELEERLAHE